jgi:hypothetical protein
LSFALWASAAVAFVNIAMTLTLLAIYIGTYRKIKSSFTLGLVLFGSFFVILNLSILVFWLFLFQNVNVSSATALVDQASFYMLLVNIGEALALSNLLRVTWK